MPEFTFVAADQHGRPKKSDSKLVRSICMRGKNAKPDSRRAKRHAKRRLSPKSAASQSAISTSDEGAISEGLDDLPAVKDPLPAYEARMCSPVNHMLRQNASMMSFLNGVDKRSRDIMCKYMTYSVSANLLYPVERCLNFYRAVDYLEIMCLDESFLLSSLLSACCMNDYVMGQSPSALTIRHLRKLLMRLNSQLSNVNSKNIWAVIFTVLTLGNVASVFSDYNAATMHIQGLERIVELHCGKEYLREYPKFHFKIDRLDLSRSVSIGKRPLFRPHSVVPEFSWRPFFAGSNPLPAHLTSALSTPMDTFPKFTVVYNDLRHLTNLINDHIAAGTLMSTEMFHSAIHSIQSRIIYLEGMMEDGVAECLRLGMLACLTTTFRLPGRKMEYTYLKERLRDMLQGVRIPSLGAQRMVFWALMMGIVAVFEADEQWIPHVWSRVVGERMNWEEARKRLRNGIWITCVHDAPAEQVFLKLELRRMEVGKW